MDGKIDTPTDTFIQVAEVWVPKDDVLVYAAGDTNGLGAFEEASRGTRFAKGEGLPGKAWAEARPVVLKGFDGSYFKRTEVAKEAGLSAAVAVPVFDGDTLKAVLVVLCGDDAERIGAIEVWTANRDGLLMLDDGYYGAAEEFAFVSQHTCFPRGQGLPGGVWAADAPILMRDLGSGYKFVRASAAGKAGLTSGIGLPVRVPGGTPYVLTLLSALGTPIARRFEVWAVKRGGKAVLLLGPRWRLHYYAHLADIADTGLWLWAGEPVGSVGSSGNATGKPPHLHYSLVSLLPRVWLADGAPQGWKKMFYLNPLMHFDVQ